MGWLREYIWLNSSQLINEYSHFDTNSLYVGHGCSYLGIWFGLLDSCF
ncbi:hypothetical protein AMTRI_Chr11g153250 [Amborella trichopoda]